MDFSKEDTKLEDEIRDLIFERLNIDYISKDKVDYNAPIFSSFDPEEKGLDLDSVDVLELIVALREKYQLGPNVGGMEIFKSIKTIGDFIRKEKYEK